MPTLTLSTKVYKDFQLKLIDKLLKSMLRSLEVDVKICGVTSRGWVQIKISGEDEKVAVRYLANEIGLCPTNLKDVKKFLTVNGYVTFVNKKELYVDIGIFSPNIIDTVIPIQCLQTQLADGRKTALEKLAVLFGFCQNLPLTVKICKVDEENNYVESMLSQKQLILYRNWTKSLLDRLIVLGASFDEVMWALKQARCNRDIVEIEPLGLFEHAVVCKLGTDAVGLVPKIGKKLRNANFSIFNPRKTLKFFENFTL